jgi:3-phytase
LEHRSISFIAGKTAGDKPGIRRAGKSIPSPSGVRYRHRVRKIFIAAILKSLRLYLVTIFGALTLEAAPAPADAPVVKPAARGETTPVPHGDDAADDPAIWIHPNVPELSLILGTDKQGGLHIYNLDGTERAVIARESHPNNIDVLYGFKLGARTVDLAVMTTRGEHARGLQVWAIDPATREFSDVTAGGTIPILVRDEPYGCGVYKNARTGAAYVFVTSKSGAVEQHLLRVTADEQVTAERVSSYKFRSIVEACVADEELGVVYFGVETSGIWKMPAEPSPDPRPKRIAKVGEHGLRSDVEGLAIYYGPNGTGYLIVSSQGNNTFKVYERGGENRFVTTIAPVAGKYGDVEDTDGIEVTSRALPPLYPKGLFIAQDGGNSPARQNFKLFAWEDIAGTNLLINTSWTPRR